MYCTKEQLRNGITGWIDEEVIPRLPTSGKWILGTAAGLAMNNIDAVINTDIIKMLGVVNNDGLIDADKICEALKANAQRYGKIHVSLPLIGTMAFGEEDIEAVRRRIM